MENYEVRADGTVYSLRRNKILRPAPNKSGYNAVCLYFSDGRKSTKTIHRLVAEKFIPNPKGFEHVLFLNGDKNDCSVDNLKWGTMHEAHQRQWKRTGRSHQGSKNPSARLNETLVQLIRTSSLSIKQITEMTQCSRTTIFNVRNNLRWTHL